MLKFIEKILTTKKNVVKNIGDNNNIQIADNIINQSEYAELMRRRDELYSYKYVFGYDEEKQKELEDVIKRLKEYVKE